LNNSLIDGQIVKVFIRDNAGNLASSEDQYEYVPLSVQITGPTIMNWGETATFTANTAGGTLPYTNYIWYQRNDGSSTAAAANESTGSIGSSGLPIGRWSQIIGFDGLSSVNYMAQYDQFSLKCIAYDSDGSFAEDIHSVLAGGLPKRTLSEVISIPNEYSLLDNYPNPFNPTTTIQYGLPKESEVVLHVYDLTGKEVNTLVNASQAAGWYTVQWNGTSSEGEPVGTGMYIARIQAGDFSQVIKMVYLR